jgi:hypothetical protein
MLRRKVLLIVTLASLLVLSVALSACAENWGYLGSRTVSLLTERDEIMVTASEGMFNAMRLEVKNTGVEFDSLEIVFGNGKKIDVPIREYIPAGGRTRVIDLPGNNRYIRKIIMFYKTVPGNIVPAVIEAWGVKY